MFHKLHKFPFIFSVASQGTSLILEGRHNADAGWLSELRMKGDALVIKKAECSLFYFFMAIVKYVDLVTQ